MNGCESGGNCFGGNCVKRGNLIIESKEIQVDNFEGWRWVSLDNLINSACVCLCFSSLVVKSDFDSIIELKSNINKPIYYIIYGKASATYMLIKIKLCRLFV